MWLFDLTVDPVWVAELRKIDLSGKRVEARGPTGRRWTGEFVERDRWKRDYEGTVT